MIAMAMICRPKLLIADEPTTALDVTIQARILELIKDIQARLKLSVIYITHDLGVVAKVADYVNVMYAGKIIETGTVTEKVGDAVREAKAGRAEFRADRGACVQVPIGKLSFEADAIVENAVAVIKALIKAKPSSAKGVYIQSITLSATMTPGVKVDIREASVKETA